MDVQGNESEGGDGNERRKGGRLGQKWGLGFCTQWDTASDTVRKGSEGGGGAQPSKTGPQQPELTPRASAFSSSYTLKAGRDPGGLERGRLEGVLLRCVILGVCSQQPFYTDG